MSLQILQTVLAFLADEDFDASDISELIDRAFDHLVGNLEQHLTLLGMFKSGGVRLDQEVKSVCRNPCLRSLESETWRTRCVACYNVVTAV